MKDLLHGELLSRIHHQETEERLRKQSVDLEEQFEMSQKEIQQQLGKIKEAEEEYKSEDAVHYQEMTSKVWVCDIVLSWQLVNTVGLHSCTNK